MGQSSGAEKPQVARSIPKAILPTICCPAMAYVDFRLSSGGYCHFTDCPGCYAPRKTQRRFRWRGVTQCHSV